jgi:RNA polymerase sigma-70 factor (ECF subfamily)
MSLSSKVIPDVTSPTETLADLLEKIADSDRQAFNQFYNATSPKLFGIVIRILRQKSAAEDVLQDVYVKIWNRAVDFNRDRGSPMGWASTIARNCALDEVRRRAHVISTEEIPYFADIPTPDPDGFKVLEDSEAHRQLYQCLDRLEADKRQMVLLAYYHGLSRESLAARFDCPVPTMKTWLRRSLNALKQCLDSHD